MRRFIMTIAALFALSPLAASAATWEDVSRATADRAFATAPEVSGGRLLHIAASGPQLSANSGFINNFVTAGVAVSPTPCFSCVVNESSGATIGLSNPQNIIYSGEVAQFSTDWYMLAANKECIVSWAITSGSTTIDSFSATLRSLSAGPYLYGFNRARPAYSGQALLSSRLECVGYPTQTVSTTLFYQ